MEQRIYKDKLIEITDISITFFNYYYPSSKSLTVLFSDVEKIISKMPTLFNGKYRYWGTGEFITWFPKDFMRNKRNKIFILYRKNKNVRIGFTVEDSQKVFELLSSKHLFI